MDFDCIDKPGARNGWKERVDGKFVKRQEAIVYLDNQPALSSRMRADATVDGSWQLVGIDSCMWKGVAETERLVFSIDSNVASGVRFVPMEPENVTQVQMFRDSTDEDATMYAKELCDILHCAFVEQSMANWR